MFSLDGVPGSDLLEFALTAIQPVTVAYYVYSTRSTNAVGQFVSTYEEAVPVRGSYQVIPKNLYEHQGLEFQEEYVNFFAPRFEGDVTRGTSGDQFVFAGSVFECLSATPWFTIDGWTEMLCVRVGLVTETAYDFYVDRFNNFYTDRSGNFYVAGRQLFFKNNKRIPLSQDNETSTILKGKLVERPKKDLTHVR